MQKIYSPEIQAIIEAVALVYKVPPQALTVNKHKVKIANQAVAYLILKYLGTNKSDVTLMLGYGASTTVYRSNKRVREVIEVDATERELIEKAEQLIPALQKKLRRKKDEKQYNVRQLQLNYNV